MDSKHKINLLALLAILAPLFILTLIPWQGTTIILSIRLGIIFLFLIFMFIWRDYLRNWIVPEKIISSNYITDGKQYQSDLGQIYSQWVSKVLESAASINQNASMALYFYNPEEKTYTLQAPAGTMYRETVQSNNNLIKRLMSQKGSFVFQEKDVRSDWKTFFTENTWRGSECLISSIIHYKNQPAGFMVMWIDHFNKVLPSDRITLQGVADLFSAGLERIQQNEKLIYEILLQEKVINFLENVNITDPLDITLNKFVELSKSFFTYDQLTVSLIDKQSGRIMIAAMDGPESTVSAGVYIEDAEAFHNWVYKNNEVLNVKDLQKEFTGSRFGIDPEKEISTRSLLSAPIFEDDRILGMLVYERVDLNPFTERDRSYISVISSILANIIPAYNTFLQVQKNATQDGLTGLFNRRVFMEKIEDEINRARRFKSNLTLVLFDLDKFKRINDQHGHVYGDYVIQTTASIIKSSIRNIDVAARYGGEEFVLILVNTDKDHSNIVVTRITESIANHDFFKDGIHEKMTISAGLADFPEDAADAKSLIENADSAMYETKEKGGNGMTAYDSSISQ